MLFAPFAERYGLQWTPLLMVPSLLLLAMFLRSVPPIERLHEKHHALLEGLTADQRDRFIHHVHDRLQAHLDADGHDPSGHGLRDIAERLHGARGH